MDLSQTEFDTFFGNYGAVEPSDLSSLSGPLQSLHVFQNDKEAFKLQLEYLELVVPQELKEGIGDVNARFSSKALEQTIQERLQQSSYNDVPHDNKVLHALYEYRNEDPEIFELLKETVERQYPLGTLEKGIRQMDANQQNRENGIINKSPDIEDLRSDPETLRQTLTQMPTEEIKKLDSPEIETLYEFRNSPARFEAQFNEYKETSSIYLDSGLNDLKVSVDAHAQEQATPPENRQDVSTQPDIKGLGL